MCGRKYKLIENEKDLKWLQQIGKMSYRLLVLYLS
jgi:hypothetical protein